jgi:hypothetical protein
MNGAGKIRERHDDEHPLRLLFVSLAVRRKPTHLTWENQPLL